MTSNPQNKLTFSEQYANHILKHEEEKHLIGDISHEMLKEYANQLNDIIAKHKHIDEPYYIYALHHKDPMFPAAHKITFCTLLEKHIHRVPMKFSTDLWKVDNKAGHLKMVWSLPPEQKMDRVLNNPTDEKTLMWTKQAIKKSKKHERRTRNTRKP